MNDFEAGTDPIDEGGYYQEAFAALKGPGSGLRIMAWAFVMIFSAGLIYCLIKLFQTTDVISTLRYGVFAILLGQAQIALKLWFNMQLNRRAVTGEIRRVGMLLSLRD